MLKIPVSLIIQSIYFLRTVTASFYQLFIEKAHLIQQYTAGSRFLRYRNILFAAVIAYALRRFNVPIPGIVKIRIFAVQTKINIIVFRL